MFPLNAYGFALASFAVAISPGPSWVYVILSTVGHGRSAGLTAIAGNATGILCHVTAAVLGLSVLFHYSAVAFMTLKWMGVLYLFYLAYRAVAGRTDFNLESSDRERTFPKIYRDGIFVGLLNPKVSLLMLALLPQFVDASSESPLLQAAMLGSLHVVIASLTLTIIVYFAQGAARKLGGSLKMQEIFRWIAGSLFFGFGVGLALAQR